MKEVLLGMCFNKKNCQSALEITVCLTFIISLRDFSNLEILRIYSYVMQTQ